MCKDFIIIAGPCSVESEAQVITTARELKEKISPDYFRAGIWKPRTRPGSFEGVGEKGLKWLQFVQQKIGINVITEAGCANHVEKLSKHDINSFWIGARTVANPFSVQEIAKAVKNTDVNVFVKNPIHPDIELWIGAIERFLNAGIKNVYAIHRGFYPYEKTHLRNVPRWEIPIELARRFPDIKIICDPSHIAGDTKYIAEISQRAIDLNMCGLMIESHYNPEIALSDKKQQLTPDQLKALLSSLNFRTAKINDDTYKIKLADLREKIDVIDYQLIDMLEHRFKLVDEIGDLKNTHNVTILQLDRWKSIVESRLDYANTDNISRDFLLKILQMIHKESIQRQNDIFGG
ncbi:MAG: chorismate mutase [Bacteroidales bacterium]|nr:chorismate mutase [Bacteroidales bacterium]MDY0142132.1 chorismate mutase [Bacteroidales bacterium]